MRSQGKRSVRVHAGALEHLAHDIRRDAADVLVTGEVLAVQRHVVGREVLRQQIDLRRGLGMRQDAAEQQCCRQDERRSSEHE